MEIYRGEKHNGVYHGKGMLYTNHGVFIGQFINGHLVNGNWDNGNGVTYEGEWKDGLPHGYGTLKNQDNSYTGHFLQGDKHGHGVITQNNITFEGEFENNTMKEGEWTITYANGSIYKGHAKDGKKHGYGKFSDLDGNSWEGVFENDQIKDGLWTVVNGFSTYVGNIVDTKKHGKGKYNSRIENDHGIFIRTYVGDFVNDHKNGKGKNTIRHVKGNTITSESYDGDWVNNEMQGFGKYIRKKSPDGGLHYEKLIVEGRFKNSLLIRGKGRYEYFSGKIYEGEMISYNGIEVPDGLGKLTDPNGSIIEGMFKDGGRHGYSSEYNLLKGQAIYDIWNRNKFEIECEKELCVKFDGPGIPVTKKASLVKQLLGAGLNISHVECIKKFPSSKFYEFIEVQFRTAFSYEDYSTCKDIINSFRGTMVKKDGKQSQQGGEGKGKEERAKKALQQLMLKLQKEEDAKKKKKKKRKKKKSTTTTLEDDEQEEETDTSFDPSLISEIEALLLPVIRSSMITKEIMTILENQLRVLLLANKLNIDQLLECLLDIVTRRKKQPSIPVSILQLPLTATTTTTPLIKQFDFTQELGIGLTAEQYFARERIAREVEDHLNEAFLFFIKTVVNVSPNTSTSCYIDKSVDFKTYRMGSDTMGLATIRSDIDFQIIPVTNYSREDMKKDYLQSLQQGQRTEFLSLTKFQIVCILKEIQRFLEEELKIVIHVIESARVPILSFEYKGLSFDISIAQQWTDSREITRKLNEAMHRIDQEFIRKKDLDILAHRLVIAVKKFYQENQPEALDTRNRGIPSIVLTIMVLAYLQWEMKRNKIPSTLIGAINGFMRFYREFDNTRFFIDSNFTIQPLPEPTGQPFLLIVHHPLDLLFESNYYRPDISNKRIINIANSVDFDKLKKLGIFHYKNPSKKG
jgi:Fe-S-cluster formation regulator IscX/YfhJ